MNTFNLLLAKLNLILIKKPLINLVLIFIWIIFCNLIISQQARCEGIPVQAAAEYQPCYYPDPHILHQHSHTTVDGRPGYILSKSEQIWLYSPIREYHIDPSNLERRYRVCYSSYDFCHLLHYYYVPRSLIPLYTEYKKTCFGVTGNSTDYVERSLLFMQTKFPPHLLVAEDLQALQKGEHIINKLQDQLTNELGVRLLLKNQNEAMKCYYFKTSIALYSTLTTKNPFPGFPHSTLFINNFYTLFDVVVKKHQEFFKAYYK